MSDAQSPQSLADGVAHQALLALEHLHDAEKAKVLDFIDSLAALPNFQNVEQGSTSKG